MSDTPPFWEDKNLNQMTTSEWESLCDGCGKCCLNKVEDEDTNEIFFTNVSCQLFDHKKCTCKNYKNRNKYVPDCHMLTPKKVRQLRWLPSTCAYRLINEGKPLQPWHHLISGSRSTVHKAGISVKGRMILPETAIKDLSKHIVTWLD